MDDHTIVVLDYRPTADGAVAWVECCCGWECQVDYEGQASTAATQSMKRARAEYRAHVQ